MADLTHVYRWDGATLTILSGPGVSFSTASNLVTVEGVTGFSEWYIGEGDAESNVGDWRLLGRE